METLEQKHKPLQSLSLAFIDIDNFKGINDNYGHLVGDHVLKKVASMIKDYVRTSDTVARYGGDEFVILMYKCDEEHAKKRMEELIQYFKKHPIKRNNQKLYITLSIGIATYPKYSLKNLIKYADQSLYDAKERKNNLTIK